ncbi:hypothetical protein ARMGADRAFT_1035951 [Armillaria gallica]|uniref:Uncharacterized protein n=1 Tax=Armillaria gallica TaxID=47427 RepID=A0A2H3CVV5_ARMGA|nr:hypothetical protein ARMGADRAFT_1035951 [Armillaria gallica]
MPYLTLRLPYLAYMEWFTPFSSHPEANSGLYTTPCLVSQGERQAAVNPVEYIWWSVTLLLKFGSVAPRNWTSSNDLEWCLAFRVSRAFDFFLIGSVWHILTVGAHGIGGGDPGSKLKFQEKDLLLPFTFLSVAINSTKQDVQNYDNYDHLKHA